MQKVKKILNDPVHGFISIPEGLIFQLVEHPYFQRLRRIKQVSLTHYVYPGALHTRFHHALGAFHLVSLAIETLRAKGVDITPEEAEGVSVAVLLHDIGHGPFSHTLEHTLINVHHESLSLWFMEKLNREFDGRLSMAIEIFRDRYPKPFLHQLVSGQLDMDRMDYLSRDSFFTGVYEGVIGYDRIIKMLNVHEGNLVVEEKGVYSIEKFLMARRLMYWQVYLHKTVVSAEQMLIKTIKRAKELYQDGVRIELTGILGFFLSENINDEVFAQNKDALLDRFAQLDDADIAVALKSWRYDSDPILSYLAGSLMDRKLFKLEFYDDSPPKERIARIRQKLMENYPGIPEVADYFLIQGTESNTAYTTQKDEILVLMKDGRVLPASELTGHGIYSRMVAKHYLCYPKGTI
ncbi:MAG: HD domain-containing protein [Lewinellaceae bacterium]|nr:HD domain-containing protein [Lewinellaceae bacterium]